jgi:nucleoid DNA-binding protein
VSGSHTERSRKRVIGRIELADAILEATGMPSHRTSANYTGGYRVVEIVFEQIAKSLQERKRVHIRDFGTFYVKDVKAAGAATKEVNPKIKSTVETNPRVYFVPCDRMKSDIDNPLLR